MGTIAMLQMMELVDTKRVAENLSASPSAPSTATVTPQSTQTHASRAEKLDMAVWTKVFACLDHRALLCGIECVCVRFERASSTGAGWHNGTLHRFGGERRLLLEFVAAMGPRLRALTSISIHYPPNENRNRPFAERHLTRLETLRVEADQCFPLAAYVARLPRTLKRLEVVGSRLVLTPTNFLALVARSEIERLGFECIASTLVTDDPREHCPRLLALAASSSSSSSQTNGLRRLCIRSDGVLSAAAWHLVAYLPQLRHLEVVCGRRYAPERACRFDWDSWRAAHTSRLESDSKRSSASSPSSLVASPASVLLPMPELETLVLGLPLHSKSLRAICQLGTLRTLHFVPGFGVEESLGLAHAQAVVWDVSASTSLEAIETDVALDAFTWRMPRSLRRFTARVILQSSGAEFGASLAHLTELEIPRNMTLSPLLEKTLAPDCVRKRYRIPIAPKNAAPPLSSSSSSSSSQPFSDR